VAFGTIAAAATGRTSLADVLRARGVSVFYADAATASNPAVAQLLNDPRAAGFRAARSGRDAGGRWAVLVRVDG
jgi:hypothetical protein